MRLRTWLVAALGLGSLVVLMAVSMLASARTTQDIYVQLDELNRHHRRVEESLRRLRSDVNLSGIFVRDYLLDVARERAPEYRQQIAEFRRTNLATLAELKALIEHDQQIASLEAKLDEYWQAFEPLFDWTTTEKILRSASFLRREVVPRREAALTIAREIEQLNNDNLAAQQQEVARRQIAVREELRSRLWQTVSLGLWSRWSWCGGSACSSDVPTRPSTRCASCRSSSSMRRRKSASICPENCTITSLRC